MNPRFDNLFQDKRVLVTGDTGFKGSWLCIWLHELGAHVYGYALPPHTPDDNFVTTNLSDIVHHADGDVRDLARLTAYFSEVQPHIAFHLAAQSLVLESYEHPYDTFSTNLMGTVNFFEAVRHCPSVTAAINITSDKCYQNDDSTRTYRESDPMGGDDPYSASKGCAELITRAYEASFFSPDGACAVASARAGNVIGGGDWAKHRLVPDIFRALHAREPVLLRHPNATRPWQHVLEPLGGYLLLASRLYAEGKSFSGPWNFGPSDHSTHSVLELVQGIIKKLGTGAYRILDDRPQPHEALSLRLDASKSITRLGWQPALTFDDTLNFTVTGYRDDANRVDMYSKRVAQIERYVESRSLRVQ